MSLLEGKSIMVVDDDRMLREILRDEFVFQGAKVTEAPNGSVAFDLLKKQPFDAVVSDVRMPDGDGRTLIRNIQSQLTRKPKVFLHSGFHDIPAEEAKKNGVIQIFSKPFDLDALVESLAEALKVKRP